MHELGVLKQIVRLVVNVAEQNDIEAVKKIILEVGETSGFVPRYLTKMFPVAADMISVLQKTELCINIVQGKGLVIKEIAY